jgi:hypothetical protein
VVLVDGKNRIRGNPDAKDLGKTVVRARS